MRTQSHALDEGWRGLPMRATPAHGPRAAAVAWRTVDLVVASALLLVLAPVLVLIGVLIRVDSSGPALFRQRRVGVHGRAFTVNKFRTMYHGAPADRHREYVSGLIRGSSDAHADGRRSLYKLATDPRVTRLGRFLRRWSIDELPQLWNVVRGQMSLVGPRPAIPYELEHYRPDWLDRFTVKPGLTGLWQVSGRSELGFNDMMRLDLEYARSWSVWLNLRILARTTWAVLHGRGAA